MGKHAGDMGGDPHETDQPLAHRRMEERALGRGWLLPQEKRDRIARRLLKALKSDNERYALGAAKTLVSADLKQQEIDLKKGESNTGLADLLRAAEEYDREHGQGDVDSVE